MIAVAAEHGLAESGMDSREGCFIMCRCGWESSRHGTSCDAHKALAEHIAGNGGPRTERTRRGD